jgi:hypothetical protein
MAPVPGLDLALNEWLRTTRGWSGKDEGREWLRTPRDDSR